MSGTVYTINKGVNRPVEFRGLRGQYIWWLAGGIVALLGGFAVLYIAGVNPFVCVGFAGIAGFVLFWQVYRFSRVYGIHGWMKRGAAKRLPVRIKSPSRRAFIASLVQRQGIFDPTHPPGGYEEIIQKS